MRRDYGLFSSIRVLWQLKSMCVALVLSVSLMLPTGVNAGNATLIEDINTTPQQGSSDPRDFFQWQGKLFFTANDTSGRKIWYTDGSEQGTKPFLKTVLDDDFEVDSSHFVFNESRLFFFAKAQGEISLWVADSTGETVRKVDLIGASLNVELKQALAGNKLELFFVGDSLVIFKNTTLPSFRPEPDLDAFVIEGDSTTLKSLPYDFPVYNSFVSNNALYVFTNDNLLRITEPQLFETDEDALVADHSLGNASNFTLAETKELLVTDNHFWKLDSEKETLDLIFEYDGVIDILLVNEHQVVFERFGDGLYSFSLETNTETSLMEIDPSTNPCSPYAWCRSFRYIGFFPGGIEFSRSSYEHVRIYTHDNNRLERIDLEISGPAFVQADRLLYQSYHNLSIEDERGLHVYDTPYDSFRTYSEILTNDGLWYVSAFQEATGQELWVLEPGSYLPRLVKDINAQQQTESSRPSSLSATNGGVMFFAQESLAYNSPHYWYSYVDGSETVSQLFNAGDGSHTPELDVARDFGYILEHVGGYGEKEVKTLIKVEVDGDRQEIVLPDNTYINEIYPIGNSLLLSANNVLFKTSAAFDEICPIYNFNLVGESEVANLTYASGKAYFTTDKDNNTTLWSTDGTEAGTMPVTEVSDEIGNIGALHGSGDWLLVIPRKFGWEEVNNIYGFNTFTQEFTLIVEGPFTNFTNIDLLAESEGKILFSTWDWSRGYTYWLSDGTTEGTVEIPELTESGDDNAISSSMRLVGNQVFYLSAMLDFRRLDLNTRQSFLIEQEVNEFALKGDKAYLSKNEDSIGTELWQTDISVLAELPDNLMASSLPDCGEVAPNADDGVAQSSGGGSIALWFMLVFCMFRVQVRTVRAS